MQEEALTTGVDDLVQLLKDKGKLPLKDASKELGIPETTLQLWVDYLVEERILGVEYKFTKAYIFVNKSDSDDSSKDMIIDITNFKKEFEAHLRDKKIPATQIALLWSKHLNEALDKLKPYFIQEVQKRNLHKPELLFEAYKKRITMMQ